MNAPWRISCGKIIDSKGKVVCGLPRRKDNRQANLIAAAPEMHRLLREFCDNCEAMAAGADPVPRFMFLTLARAVLAQAEGRAE